MRAKNRDSAARLVATPRAFNSTASSASVMCEVSATRAFSQSACASSGERRPPACGFGHGRPSALKACIHFTAVDALTSSTFAAERAERPLVT